MRISDWSSDVCSSDLLVDIDDALLRFFDVAVCGLQKFGDDAFDIFADIAGLGQRGGVDHDEWHVESASDRAGEKRFAGSRWADQKDVRFFEFNIAALGVSQSFVVIVDRHRENHLGPILTDDILVEEFANLAGSWIARTPQQV